MREDGSVGLPRGDLGWSEMVMWYFLIIRTCCFDPKQTKATKVIQQKPGNIDVKMCMLKQYTPLCMFGGYKTHFWQETNL